MKALKIVFRMLISTAVAAGVLYLLYITYGYFAAESMLGATVDRIISLCFQALAVVTVLLYVRCWLSLLVDGIKALVRRRRAGRTKAGVRMTITADAPAHVYDREAAEAEPTPAEPAAR